MLYSKITHGFYTPEIHGENIPIDAVEITDAHYRDLLNGQTNGQAIEGDDNGNPVLSNRKYSKEQLWRQIKAVRDRKKGGGFLLNGKWYHSDHESLTRYLALNQLGQNAPSRNWKTMDGSTTPMTPALASQIFAAAIEHDASCFDTAEAHRSAMEASADHNLYDFSAGWPDTYPG